MLSYIFIFALNIFLVRSSTLGTGCAISVNRDLLEPQPLLLRPGLVGNTNEVFYLPDEPDGTIYFSTGQEILIACPRRKILLNGVNQRIQSAIITCSSGRNFIFRNNRVNFRNISCTDFPFHNAFYNGNRCLNGRGNEISIGFRVNGTWLNHITSCFDNSTQNVLYTTFYMTKSIQGFQTGFPRPSWMEGNFFNTRTEINTLYSRGPQRTQINSILGLDSGDTTYIHGSNDFFLSRGHLTAKSDWVFGAQHRLTFYFVNAAPQFQTFNSGNWAILETDVQNFAGNRQLNLQVFTGLHGATSLPDVNGVQQDLYLYTDYNGNFAIAVPRLYWKVLYDPVSKTAIAFVGVNNPYQVLPERDILCTNICNRVNWLTWKAESIRNGYSYCCEVNDLKRNVENIPNLDINGLLL